MLIRDSEKTKLAPKFARYVLVAVGVIFIGLLGALTITRHTEATHPLIANNKTYHVIVATTPAVQEKGLGERANLPADEGMLFVFPGDDVRCFWMKDMHFSIDMIWLNAQKQVVHIQPNVSPNTYPETFCPSSMAEYVLELNAGQARVAGIQTGQTLNF